MLRTIAIGACCCMIVGAAGCKLDAPERKEPEPPRNATLTQALRKELGSLPAGVKQMTCWGTASPFFLAGSVDGYAHCSIELTGRAAEVIGRSWYRWDLMVRNYSRSAFDEGWPRIVPQGFEISDIEESGFAVIVRPSSDGQLDAYVNVRKDRLSLQAASAFALQVVPSAAGWTQWTIQDADKNAPDTKRSSWGG
ncbi:hypothetical protein WK78_03080 [Burkholderia cepacia]|uniref:hypothetical protein n=1 Tax=Burkholderia cepacia TaxID=292 RepID=UPI00076DF3D1|nr:hypothetical protein [Burkholderia cepacia]KVV25091.1 hypothetical protein WK78_03080 [Burkholderia cepacia]